MWSLHSCVDRRLDNWCPIAAEFTGALGSWSGLKENSPDLVVWCPGSRRPTNQYWGPVRWVTLLPAPGFRLQASGSRFPAPGSTSSSVSGLPSTPSLPRSSSTPDVGLPVLPPVVPVQIGLGHPFSVNRFDCVCRRLRMPLTIGLLCYGMEVSRLLVQRVPEKRSAVSCAMFRSLGANRWW